jgi:hypothetical protein
MSSSGKNVTKKREGTEDSSNKVLTTSSSCRLFSLQHHFVEEWKDMSIVRTFFCFEEILET